MINYPYLPKGRSIFYVSADNEFMRMAFEYAKVHSLDSTMPTAAIIAVGGKVKAMAANGSNYHKMHQCERVRLNIPTGHGYELCEGCHPKNHAEARAIAKLLGSESTETTEGTETREGIDLYLWGHWWCCEDCWKAMIAAGINRVFLQENSEVLFNKQAVGNIVGKQFE